MVYYENQAGKFKPTILASQAQGLALGLFDVNNDNRPDILVGNDFAVPGSGLDAHKQRLDGSRAFCQHHAQHHELGAR